MSVPVGFAKESEKLEANVVKGGLYKRKDAETSELKTPKSMFGLDQLAVVKKQEALEKEKREPKKARLNEQKVELEQRSQDHSEHKYERERTRYGDESYHGRRKDDWESRSERGEWEKESPARISSRDRSSLKATPRTTNKTDKSSSSSTRNSTLSTPVGTPQLGPSVTASLSTTVEEPDTVSQEVYRDADDEDDLQFYRDFYDADESETFDNNKAFVGDESKVKQVEEEVAKRSTVRVREKNRQYNQDNDRWEENRMLTSGVARRLAVQTEQEDDLETRVHILVHDMKPPFLDGRVVYTKQQKPVIPVKDPSSDLAIISRNGSQLLREHREKMDRQKSVSKFWELAGSNMGNIIGIKKKEGRTILYIIIDCLIR